MALASPGQRRSGCLERLHHPTCRARHAVEEAECRKSNVRPMTSAGLSESSEPLCSAVQRGHIAGAMPIVTSTYRYKPPPKRKGRKLAQITGPAIVTIDPKTRVAKKGGRPGEGGAAAAK